VRGSGRSVRWARSISPLCHPSPLASARPLALRRLDCDSSVACLPQGYCPIPELYRFLKPCPTATASRRRPSPAPRLSSLSGPRTHRYCTRSGCEAPGAWREWKDAEPMAATRKGRSGDAIAGGAAAAACKSGGLMLGVLRPKRERWRERLTARSARSRPVLMEKTRPFD